LLGAVAWVLVSARDVIARYLAAMKRGDRDAVVALYADDVVMRVPGRSAFAGERRGGDECSPI
jgi:ketosteroid isomerase-like protein